MVRSVHGLSVLLLSACASGGVGTVRQAVVGPNGPPATTPHDSAPPAPSDSGGTEDTSAPPDTSRPPDTGPPPVLRVGLIADLNGSYGSTTYGDEVHLAAAQLAAWGPDLVLSAGDMVAGQQGGLDYRAMWTGFHAAMTDPLAAAGVPLAPSPGNHDASGYSGYEQEREIYADEWQLRRPDLTMLDDADYPFRYAFAQGGALFVALDATKVGPLDGEQVAWLDAVLDADLSPKVVFGHLPLLPFAGDIESEVIGDESLEGLLVAHGVDVWFSGHHHAYYPGRRGALRLVGLGCLGAAPRELLGESEVSPRTIGWLEISAGAILAVEGLAGKALDTPIPREDLPEQLGSGDEILWRDDL